MKKLFTLIVASLLAISTFAVEEDGSLNPMKDFTHWSLAINGGISQFDGDCYQRHNQMLSSSYLLWTVGIEAEYSFNPAWGVILNFQYMPYQGHTNKSFGKRYFRGNMYNVHAMGSINVLNLFGQYRKSAKWAWYINGGLGFTFYDAVSRFEDDYEPTGTEEKTGDIELKDMRCFSFPVGTQVEYNINKYLAVGLSAYYRFHSKDNFEAENYTHGTMNDGEFYATASLRVKFAPNKKEGGHVRNVSMYDYRKACTNENQRNTTVGALDSLAQRLDSLEGRVKALEDTMNNNVLPRLAAIEHEFETEPDEDGDGVPDFRDREPNTPQGSFVNYWGESVGSCCDKVEQIAELIGLGIDYDMSVYFDFDKSYITSAGRDNIAKAAKKLKEDPELQVELRGYCDFPGKQDYNLKLSQTRVDNVAKELKEKYGIDASRISVTPKGRLQNPPLKEAKNRRCDFYFHK